MGKLIRFNNEDTDKVNIFESTIIHVSNDSNHNVIFIVDWLEGDPIKIIFENVSDIIFDLNHNPSYEKELIGVLEIRGFSYKKEKGLYLIQFNFDTVLLGKIRVTCKNFSFNLTSLPITSGGNDNML